LKPAVEDWRMRISRLVRGIELYKQETELAAEQREKNEREAREWIEAWRRRQLQAAGQPAPGRPQGAGTTGETAGGTGGTDFPVLLAGESAAASKLAKVGALVGLAGVIIARVS
jgi:hypothetical protein